MIDSSEKLQEDSLVPKRVVPRNGGRKKLRKPGDKHNDRIQWSPDMQTIFNMHLNNWKQKRIIEETGFSVTKVSDIMKSPIYKKRLERHWERVQNEILRRQVDLATGGDPVENRLKELAPKAVDVKAELLDSKNGFLKNNVASDILDRLGYVAKMKNKTSATMTLSDEQASRFAKILGLPDTPKSVTLTKEIEE